MNSKLCCFNDFIISDDGLGRTENKYVNLDRIKVLNTVILPIVVSLCFFHDVISLRNCSILGLKFSSIICSDREWKCIPRALAVSLFHMISFFLL